MRKENMIRLFVEPSPRNFLTFLVNLSDFLFFWVFSDGFFVAFDTDCYFGHARKGLVFKMGMAGDTFNSLFLMFLMVKGDWLFRLGT